MQVALLSVVVAVYYQSVYGTQSHCDLGQVDLTDKVVVVTGANTGIGYHIAVEAASRYWVTHKLPQICTVIWCFCIGKVA